MAGKDEILTCLAGSERLGEYSGPACVVGSSRSVWDELRRLPEAATLIAVNVQGCFVPNVRHWCSVHPELFEYAEPLRRWLAQHYPGAVAPLRHAWVRPEKTAPDADIAWYGDMPPDLSGCFGVMVALQLGYSPVYTCGITHDNGGHVYEPYGSPIENATYDLKCHTWHRLAQRYGRVLRPMAGQLKHMVEAYA